MVPCSARAALKLCLELVGLALQAIVGHVRAFLELGYIGTNVVVDAPLQVPLCGEQALHVGMSVSEPLSTLLGQLAVHLAQGLAIGLRLIAPSPDSRHCPGRVGCERLPARRPNG